MPARPLGASPLSSFLPEASLSHLASEIPLLRGGSNGVHRVARIFVETPWTPAASCESLPPLPLAASAPSRAEYSAAVPRYRLFWRATQPLVWAGGRWASGRAALTCGRQVWFPPRFVSALADTAS